MHAWLPPSSWTLMNQCATVDYFRDPPPDHLFNYLLRLLLLSLNYVQFVVVRGPLG